MTTSPLRHPRLPWCSASAAGQSLALVAAVLLLLDVELCAQHQFAPAGNRTLPGEPGDTTYPGDIDGDGDLDLLLRNADGYQLWCNDGHATFRDVTANALPDDLTLEQNAHDLLVGDFDGDGDLDLVRIGSFSTGASARTGTFLNNGQGVFSNLVLRGPSGFRPAVSGDVDGDGDLDIITSNGTTGDVALNDGSGNFLPAGSAPPGHLHDLDGDGDLDIFVARYGQDLLLLNDGSGTFTDVTTTHLPAISGETRAVVARDIDGDGDEDLVLAADPHDRLYLNDGSGVMRVAPAGQLPPASSPSVDLGDIDGDGDLDLIRGASLLLNDGLGSFSDATSTRIPNGSTGRGRFGDYDGDGSLDILLPRRLLLNDGSGWFFDATQRRLPDLGGRASTFVDVDGDGDLDVVVATTGRNRLYLNDGNGNYVDRTVERMPADESTTNAIGTGDLDGDGDTDLVCANIQHHSAGSARDRIYLNDGAGTFTDRTDPLLPSGSRWTSGLAVVDVDGDGDLDLVTAQDSGCGLFLNDGLGRFTDATTTHFPRGVGSTRSIVAGDVDGDGDLDILTGGTTWVSGMLMSTNRLYLNDGSGVFVERTTSPLASTSDRGSSVVKLGDVDGDGDLDIVIGGLGRFCCGSQGSYVGGMNHLLLNDGTGHFVDVTASHMGPATPLTTDLTLDDVDGDGDLDILTSESWGSTTSPFNAAPRNRFYVNDGSGRFTDASDLRLPRGRASKVTLGDVDGDGDLDALFSEENQSRLYVNLQRHLQSPGLLRPGQPFVLEASARLGPHRLFDVALPFLSTTRASLTIPGLGHLGIDLGNSQALDPVLIPHGGTGTVTVQVPNDPGLVGMPVFAQAVVVRYPLDTVLTNVTADTVR